MKWKRPTATTLFIAALISCCPLELLTNEQRPVAYNQSVSVELVAEKTNNDAQENDVLVAPTKTPRSARMRQAVYSGAKVGAIVGLVLGLLCGLFFFYVAVSCLSGAGIKGVVIASFWTNIPSIPFIIIIPVAALSMLAGIIPLTIVGALTGIIVMAITTHIRYKE